MKSDFSSVKVAIATDSMPSFGGADRLLMSLLDLFPNAEIFTAIYNPKTYSFSNRVHTSFIQYIPFLKRHLSFLFPFVFEIFDFRGFDFVISISAGPAKGVITGVNQPHISIINTPPRHQWDREVNARGSILKRFYEFGSIFLSHYLRIWDISASKRADTTISISKYIQKKVKRIYGKESSVAYPGVTKDWFEKVSNEEKERVRKKYNLRKEFLLTVSRLFDHKKIDWAIKAAIKTKQHIYIGGAGPDRKFLERTAQGSEYIHFLGYIPEEDLKPLHSLAQCFLFPALDDFGYVALEAMSQGVPVFCFNEGGSIEVVEDGKSGNYFENINELSKLISKKTWTRYNPEEIRKRAKKFSQERFLKSIEKGILKVWKKK